MKYLSLFILILLPLCSELHSAEKLITSKAGAVTKVAPLSEEFRFKTGEAFETTGRLSSPSELFPNARVTVIF